MPAEPLNESNGAVVIVLMSAASPGSQAIVERLTERGLIVHVVDFNHAVDGYLNTNPALEAESLRALQSKVHSVHQVRTPRLLAARVLVGAWRLRQIAKAAKAEVVLTLYGGTNAAIAWLSGLRPYLVYIMGSDVLLADWIRRIIARITLSGASVVPANGNHLSDRTRSLAPGARVRPLYLGIDLTRYKPRTTRNPTPTFVCSRGFDAVYDNETIIRAVASLSDMPRGFTLDFLAAGPLLSRTIALADRVIPSAMRRAVAFTRGIHQELMPAALRPATHYVSASLSDGASTSLLEAMATGLFPILSDIPANREWISDGRNGLLFPPGDQLALAAAMKRAAEWESWMDAAIEYNYRLMRQHADVDVTISELLQLLRQARSRHASRHLPSRGLSEWPSSSPG